MVRELPGSGRGVDVVIGKADTGKTYALDAARDPWARSGQRVIGCALAAAPPSSCRLARASPRRYCTRCTRTSTPTAGSTTGRSWFDEAGMVGTRQLARLLDHAASANAKVVLVGDPHQLPAVDAGGLLAGLAARPADHRALGSDARSIGAVGPTRRLEEAV